MNKQLFFRLRALAQPSYLTASGTLPMTLTPPAGRVTSFTLLGKTVREESTLRSVGEGGALALPLTDTQGAVHTVRITLPHPLRAVGEVRDTLSLSDGILTRRTAYVSLSAYASSVKLLGTIKEASVFRLTLPETAAAVGDACLSSHLTTYIGPSAMYGSSYGCTLSGGALWLTLNGVMTEEQAQAYLAEVEIGVVYALAEEMTDAVTPPSLPEGIRSIGSDEAPAADVSVRYLAAEGR